MRRRFDLLVREVAKFGAVGGAGAARQPASCSTWYAHTHRPARSCGPASSPPSSRSSSTTSGFRYFTYRDRDKSGRTKELTLFLLFSAVGLVIENGVLYAATYGFGWDSPLQSNVFKFVGIGVATLFRFWSYRTWVFRTLPAREAVASAESFLDEAPSRGARRGHATTAASRRTQPADRAPAAAVRPPALPDRRLVVVLAAGGCFSGVRDRNRPKTGGCGWSSLQPARRRPPRGRGRRRGRCRWSCGR